nr:hypothetical protein [Tanacetum cinerariifolium]
MAVEGPIDLPVPDLRTMEELCQPSLNGRGGPIASIAIQAMNFGLKNDMIQQSIKVNGVTDDALRLYLFPHSLTHHATAWFDRLLRNSINTFEQMAKMFLGKYFPPSMLSIDRCPNHNMLPVTQIDTFYNGLTLRHRDTINAAAGGTFMKRRPEECYDLIENMTAHHNDWDTSAQRKFYKFSEPTLSSRPTNVEVQKELPKVSMMNTSLKKLKPHLASFDMVVKERTTTTSITEGTWGFKHTKACFRDEIIPFVKALKDLFNSIDQFLVDEQSDVQNVFHQMEQAMEQHREIFQQDHSVSNQSAPSFDHYFELNELKAQSQEKDTVITLKDALRKLKGKALADNVVTSHSVNE